MASSHHTQFETIKSEQIITAEFFTKSLHIILESRSPYTSSRSYGADQVRSFPSPISCSSPRSRDKWFNLALRECSGVLENIDLCRQGHLEPMVVDVILVQKSGDLSSVEFSPRRDLFRNLSVKEPYPISCSSDHEEFGSKLRSEKIVERWLIQHERGKGKDISSGSRRSNNITLQKMYMKSILLLRSLYATIRLLPAYKIFRELCSSSQIHPFTLAHRVSSFVEPLTRREEAKMQQFRFTPVDTPSGKLCVSLVYRSSLSDVIFEPSNLASPQVIADYVGSPLADPLKRFHALPVSGQLSNGSPSSFPYSRPHSWSHNQYRASPPSAPFSPSPTHPELHSSISVYRPEKACHKKNTTYFPSSLPTSLSPPIFTLERRISKASSQPESVPVDIPAARPSSSHKFLTEDISSLQAGYGVEKPFSPHGDETRMYSGQKISSDCSPRISVSRSSKSSQSFLNDDDELDFPCPFDLDGFYAIDQSHRPELLEPTGNVRDRVDSGGSFPIGKSQDAAVGALVHMLKKAAPLRQDLSNKANNLRASTPNTRINSNSQEDNQVADKFSPAAPFTASSEVTYSRPTRTKTTAEALEELQSYRELKILLLSQTGYSQLQPKYVSVSDSSSE